MKKAALFCNFRSIGDQFNFGRYRSLSLADVLEINPSYLNWCLKHCTGVIVQLEDDAVEEIKVVYPTFIMDALFESNRIWNLKQESLDEEDDYEEDGYNDKEMPSYDRYSGCWAQEQEGYSDDDIDIVLDGDPSAYWNID